MATTYTQPQQITPRDAVRTVRHPDITDLLRVVQAHDGSDLVAVGVALHHFTELVRDVTGVPPVELHQATTILTKQIMQVLHYTDALVRIQRLVTNPDRIATVDGRTAAELCGTAWSAIRAVAGERAAAAIEGSRSYGVAPILRLAATRAAGSHAAWWGTRTWAEQVDAWLADVRGAELLRASLQQTPEHVDIEMLADILDW